MFQNSLRYSQFQTQATIGTLHKLKFRCTISWMRDRTRGVAYGGAANSGGGNKKDANMFANTTNPCKNIFAQLSMQQNIL